MNQPVLGMILKGYPRISETFISNEILLLERAGIPIRIFSMRHPREPFCHDSVKQIRARVDYLPTELFLDFKRLFFHNFLLAVRQPKTYIRAIRKAGERFNRTHNLGTVKHLLQAGYLVNKLLRHSPEVTHLHAHFAHSPTSVAFFSSLLSELPFSFTAHAKDIYTSNPEQIREKIDLATFVVTCTEYNRRYLKNLAPKTKTPIAGNYHGIDLQLFSNHTLPRIPVQPYKILTVARLTAKKGLPTVIRSLCLLKDQGIDFKFTLIGDGEDRDTILALIVELGLAHNCRWLGTMPHDQVIKKFKASDLFVLGCEIAPNKDRDGIPNVLVESLAMGVPVVATTTSAIPELIENESSGLLIEPTNPDQMATAIKRLLTDNDLRERVRNRGLKTVARNFDNTRLTGKLAQLYKHFIPAFKPTP